MAQGRRRPPKPTQGGRRQGSGVGVPWLWLGLLAVAGATIVTARTLKLPAGEGPQSAEPTFGVVGAAPTRTPDAARLAPTPATEPTVRATAAAAAPVAVRASRATPASTRAPLAVPATTATRASAAAQAATATRASAAVPATTATPAAQATPATVTPSPSVPSRATPTPAASRLPAASEPGPTAAEAAPPAGEVALTFDAGSDRGYAEDILDMLQEQHVSASFGITGQWASANAEVVRRMAADGHMVINHTLDHHSFTGLSDQLGGLSAARRRAELEEADAIIAPLIGHSTRPWYRLPYGDDDARVVADVAPAGYSRKVGWTVDSLGWRGTQSGDILARCLKLAAPGGVYVLHVGRASQDAIALPQIIEGLRDKGFGFARVDGL